MEAILAIETSSKNISVSIATKEQSDISIAIALDKESSPHSEYVLTLIDQALKQTHMELSDLTGIAVGIGPGSFTGLRIGLATAKGLCFAQQIPLYCVSSLEALACSVHKHTVPRIVATIVDAKKGEVFASAFEVNQNNITPLLNEVAIAPATIPQFFMPILQQTTLPVFSAGTAAPLLDSVILCTSPEPDTPQATSVATLAFNKQPTNVASAIPAYRREVTIRTNTKQ